MAWGQRAGVQDLLDRLEQPATAKNLYVLSTRKLTDADAKRLADTIACNTQLEELYLSGHKLSTEALQAFAECLAVNTTLKHLCVGHDAFGDDGVAVLCDGIARNASSVLQVWDLEYKSIGSRGAAALGKLLAHNTALHTLTVSRNALGDDAVGTLLAGLGANPHAALETLQLTDIGITGAALEHYATLLTQPTCSLQTLQLSFNALESASSAFFDALATNTSLRTLYLKDCQLSDVHATALGDALARNHTLETLDLSDNRIGPNGCVALVRGLQHNSTLQSLTLGNNTCGDVGASALADALATNTTLSYVDLSKNALTPVGIHALLARTQIKELHVFNNTIGAGMHELLPAIVANTHIQHLDVGANQLHGDLSIALFDALHTHATLTTLEMGGNSLGETGHVALERLRAANPALDVAVDKNAQDENGHFDHGEQQQQ